MLKVQSGRAICIRLIEFIIQIIRRTLLHYVNLYLAGIITIIPAYLVRAFFMHILQRLQLDKWSLCITARIYNVNSSAYSLPSYRL
jgi:hypothetical protein